MSEWHYAKEGQKHGPVGSEEIRRLAASGELRPEDLVWKDGMSEWLPAGSVQNLAAALAAGLAAAPQSPAPQAAADAPQPLLGYYSPMAKGDATLSPKSADMLRQTKPWVRFMSIMCFIFAGLMVVATVAIAAFTMNARFGSGVPGVISLIYLAMACLYIAPGIFLGRYASRIASFLLTQQNHDLDGALEAQKSFWKFTGMTAIAVIAVYLVVIVVVLVTRL